MTETPKLDIRELVAVDCVARARSFKLAAEVLHTSQPTLSRLISSAEDKLCTKIFDRGWSGADTTSQGDVVARFSGYVVSALDAAEAMLFSDQAARLSLRTNLRSNQIEMVAAICRYGSVTQAALALGRSQSDLSRMLSNLSKRFGLDLFTRSPAGMTPLLAANTLAELEGHISYYQAQMREQLGLLEADIVGRVSVGLLPFSGQDLILKTFGALTNDHPHVRLLAVPGSYNSLVGALRRREIDRIVGIARGDDCPRGLIEKPLYEERFAVIAKADHPLHAATSDADAFTRTNWIVAPHGTPVRSYFEAVFSDLNIAPPTQTCELLSFGTAEQMLIDSNSVAMLTYSERKLAELRSGLAEVATGLPKRRATIALTRLADEPHDAALAEFECLLDQVVQAAA
ncbi:LysR family transcriptional regulator [Maritimibacter sp. UBA3975]|uniref:LysR family transcriptional regulator n=1 Tax=Maritimibacter sp. UBA3975 TaxID=1946833 RepID=UPI0025BA21C2|nr:LysR family transcriptional regulator [Maritimibacter sp. UBA3975]|tara:strand:- start:16625 stop:17827 length:1203 start_codon:yes stop_codon:yes gene_type:complete